jgi:hypothetical protein
MVNVPHDFQDYDDDDPNIEYRRNRTKYWAALKEIRKEYAIENKQIYDQYFVQWVEEKYGFIIIKNLINGSISDMYTIVDEAKFIFFKLKYL